MGAAAAAFTTTMNPDVTMAHSISSIVRLDRRAGTAHKTYRPPMWVRALYRAAFQAPFPYTNNAAALEAARERRTIAGLLTRYWFGHDMVSPVCEIRVEADGRRAFVTELVRGNAPSDRKNAQQFLRALTDRFLEAGLPTWQVTPHNPRAAGNLIETHDGSYKIIDLESNLVAPLMPVSGLAGAIRQGNFPAFDDIDNDRLDGYIARHEVAIASQLGAPAALELRRAARAYAEAAREWHASEPRILSKALRFAFRLVDVPSWVRAIRRSAGDGALNADAFVRGGIDTWVEEGHLSAVEAAEIRQALRQPEITSALRHLGAHLAMSVPLRFPIGSIARGGWTLVLRARAEWSLLRGRPVEGEPRQVHTLAVAAASVIPGFGAGAYLLTKPLRANPGVAWVACDRFLRKMPLRLYTRFHLVSLTTFFAKPQASPVSTQPWRARVMQRLASLSAYRGAAAAMIAAQALVLISGAALYLGAGSKFVFAERSVMNTLDASQLLIAGALAIAAYRAFWAMRGETSGGEAAGIFLWGLAGMGLVVFAADDYFTLHEAVGVWIADTFGKLPLFTNTVDDVITLGFGLTGLSVLYVFRHELFAARPSSTLLLAGVAASALMVGADVYARGPLRPLEFPAQMSAVSLLLLASYARYHEVTSSAASAESAAREPAAA